MGFAEHVCDFDYANALNDLRIQGTTSLWTELEIAARNRPDMSQTQMVQDVSWVLTQVDEDTRLNLHNCRNEVIRILSDAYGPRAREMCASFGCVIESLLVPLAKTITSDEDMPAFLRRLVGQRPNRPTPRFAALFAKWWIYKQNVQQLPGHTIQPGQRGTRVQIGFRTECSSCGGNRIIDARVQAALQALRHAAEQRAAHGFHAGDPPITPQLAQRVLGFLGDPVACPQCHGTGMINEHSIIQAILAAARQRRPCATELMRRMQDNDKVSFEEIRNCLGNTVSCQSCNGTRYDEGRCRAAAATPAPNRPGKFLRDFIQAANPEGGIDHKTIVDFFGDTVFCPDCTRWIDVPRDARTDWILPIVDGHGNRHDWCRITVH